MDGDIVGEDVSCVETQSSETQSLETQSSETHSTAFPLQSNCVLTDCHATSRNRANPPASQLSCRSSCIFNGLATRRKFAFGWRQNRLTESSEFGILASYDGV